MNKRIALVLPWVGILPWYWKTWQRSAAGRSFDIVVICKTVDEFSDLVNRRLVRPLSTSTSFLHLLSGHKLCDLKPMYGVLFAEELAGYDYWAYGDCDVMYGRQFDTWLEKAVAGDYDVATVQKDFTAGPFTLVKNCEKCNRLFEKASDWRAMLEQPRTMAFDELGENWFRKMVGGGYSYGRLREEQPSFSAICWRESAAGRLRVLAESVICEEPLSYGERVTCRPDGTLLKGAKEIAMYHFLHSKVCFGFTGDEESVWMSRGWPFVQDVVRFVGDLLRGNPSTCRRVEEWWRRRKGDPDWWLSAAWNNLGQ